MSWEFLIAATAVIATPGTGALFCLSVALTDGLRAGWAAALASTVATIPHAALAVTGLASVLAANSTLFRLVGYAGGAFLLWMAWGMWHDRTGLSQASVPAVPTPAAAQRGVGRGGVLTQPRGDDDGGRTRPGGIVRDAVAMNLLNPKLTLFFVAFLPQFVPRDSTNATLTMSGLSLAFMVLTFLIYAVYAALADRLRGLIGARPAILLHVRRGFALCFVGLGGYVLATAGVLQ